MKGFWTFLSALLICGTAVWGLYYRTHQEHSLQITVQGVGTYKQLPDHVEIGLSITETGSTSLDAREHTTKIMQQLEKIFSGANISETQIKTENLTIQQLRDYSSGSRVANGYEADQRLTVTLTGENVETQAEQLLGQLPAKVKVDATNFSVKEKKSDSEEARTAAFEDAKKHAEQLAKLAGKTVGKVIAINQSVDGSVYPFMAQLSESRAVRESDAVLYAGEEEFRTILNVTFELK